MTNKTNKKKSKPSAADSNPQGIQTESDSDNPQKLSESERENREQDLDKYNSVSPKLSGGDLDANWEDASVAGDETVGGSAPTPDQDVVDKLGEAVGLTYEDDEPLGGGQKLAERDSDRWELDPESARDDDLSPEAQE